MPSTLLVTGGAGYIGSHVLVALAEAGYRPVVLDDLSNGSRQAVRRAAELAGSDIPLIEGDVLQDGMVDGVLRRYAARGTPIEGVIHLAGCKAVGESVADPLKYYEINVCGAVRLLRAMQANGVRRIVFSSSATVYGEADSMPVTEGHRLCPTNPYGRSKMVVEELLRDHARADPAFSAAILRYFNPIGAHPSGRIGECTRDTPANVFPFITQVALGRRSHLSVFGNDYDTPDGTGVRDYLHVMDLAAGHVRAMVHVLRHAGVLTVNLGTGSGASVLDLVRTFERVSGRRVPLRMSPRRPGDVAAIWADPGLAETVLGWKAARTIEDMCADGWRWQRLNPRGYEPPREPAVAVRGARPAPPVLNIPPQAFTPRGKNEIRRP